MRRASWHDGRAAASPGFRDVKGVARCPVGALREPCGWVSDGAGTRLWLSAAASSAGELRRQRRWTTPQVRAGHFAKRCPGLREAAARWREWLVNGLALLALLSVGIVWPDPASGADWADGRSGRLLLKSAPDAQPVEAVRVSVSMSAHVTGNVARVYVTHRFTNPTADWVEGLYVFPLPPGAAVDELQMRVGERVIRGEIRRKEDARAVYEQARQEGRRASLVDQERPNLFTTSVANIAPQSEVIVQIAYLDTVPFRDGRYTLNLPLAITPRYTPASSIGDAQSDAPPDTMSPSLAITSGYTRTSSIGNASSGATPERVTSAMQKAEIEVRLAPGFPLGSVRSLNHSVAITETSYGQEITLTAQDVPADRDFELIWTPVIESEVYAAAFAEEREDGAYVLVMVTPPEFTRTGSVPREVLFIIDTSGSMGGPSIEQARAALQLGVDRLTPDDRFNIIRFSNDATSLFDVPQPVDTRTRAAAARFIDGLTANGGTEMRRALELAFSMPPTPGLLRQIVFITDGSVSNEAGLVAMIRERLGNARLFTVGIGPAPNAYFMREAAVAGRGSYTFIAQVDQVRERMQDLFRKLEQPALVDLSLRWPGGASAELAAGLPGDVYAGDPLVIAARLERTPRGMLTLTGRTGDGVWVRQLPLQVVDGQAGIAKLWARERIADLLRSRRFGTDSGGAEAEIVRLALTHHLVSELTSLVAVDVTPVRPPGIDQRTEQAPTSAPAGSYWARSTGFAGTATPAPMWLLLGLLALGMAVALRWSVGARK